MSWKPVLFPGSPRDKMLSCTVAMDGLVNEAEATLAAPLTGPLPQALPKYVLGQIPGLNEMVSWLGPFLPPSFPKIEE